MTDELTDQIRRAAEVLKSFGAREVYIFGSAATGTLRPDSDVDLAVSGLPPEEFFDAYNRAADQIPDRDVDLLDLDKDNPITDVLWDVGELKRVG